MYLSPPLKFTLQLPLLSNISDSLSPAGMGGGKATWVMRATGAYQVFYPDISIPPPPPSNFPSVSLADILVVRCVVI